MTDDRDAFLRTLVVGVDGSDHAQRAVAWATGMAAKTGAEVVAVHVLTYTREMLRDLTPDTMRNWRSEVKADLETKWTKPLTDAGVHHACEVIDHDSPGDGLVEVASRVNADLIVVGASTHFGHRLGSTGYKVAHHATQPIVIIPPDWSPT